MRKLASIRVIKDIRPIPERDRIELAIIDGWQVIVKKDEFKPGDQCIYVEIDSILPEKPEFEFLRPKHFKIKTMKMGGVLSQGICFPLSILPGQKYKTGADVTDILEITKIEDLEYKAEEQKLTLMGRVKAFFNRKHIKGFPSFIQRTDEERVQNKTEVFNDLNVPYVVREKIDGQSGTFFLYRHKGLFRTYYEYGICSRNQRIGLGENWPHNDISERYRIKDILKRIIGKHEYVVIQGEVISPKVQGNKYRVGHPDFYVFNLIYPDGRRSCIEAEDLLRSFWLQWCPLIHPDFKLPETINELLNYADGKSQVHDLAIREGIVLRNYEKGISFKAISNNFLMKHQD